MDVKFQLNEIKTIAKQLYHLKKNNKIWLFQAEMGAGKTTFIHALCKVLNVKNAVSSPTFAIINEYKSVDAGIIYHMDLYRIKNEKEAVEAGIEDCLLSGNFCLVEWPDKIPGLLPDNSLQIFIDVNDNKTRRLYLG